MSEIEDPIVLSPRLLVNARFSFRHEGDTVNARKLPGGAGAAAGARVDQATRSWPANAT